MSGLDELYRGIDGDTFVLTDEDGDETRIRAGGYDAPETGKYKSNEFVHQNEEPGAQMAKQQLDELYASGNLEIDPTGEQTYNREVANLTTKDGEDVGTSFIEQGIAHPTKWSSEEQHSAAAVPAIRGEFIDSNSPLAALYSDEEVASHNELQGSKESTPYEFDPGMSKPRRAPEKGTFTSSVARGSDNLQATLYAASNALGEFTGIDPMAEWGEEGMLRNLQEAAENPAEVHNWDDVNSLGEFGTYVVEALGEQVPNLAAMATGAGTAAVALRAGIGKKLLTKLAGDKATQAAATLGAGAASYPMGVGEIQMELKEGGIDSPGTALAGGIPFAALDTVGAGVLLDTFFRGAKRDMAKSLTRQLAEGFIKRGALGAAAEVPTEMMQEIITLSSRAYHDPEFEVFSDENLARIKEAGIKAGIVGGALGGSGGVFSGIKSHADYTKWKTEQGQPDPDAPLGLPDQSGGGLVRHVFPDGSEGWVDVRDSQAMDAEQGKTAPEPVADLHAQLNVVGPDKPAVYSQDPEAAETAAKQAGGVWKFIPTEDGGVLITRPQNKEAVAAAEAAGNRHEVLGYSAPKPENPDGNVVQARDEEGNVTFQQGVNKGTPEEAAALETASKLGTVENTTAVDVLPERSAKVEAENTEKDASLREIQSTEPQPKSQDARSEPKNVEENPHQGVIDQIQSGTASISKLMREVVKGEVLKALKQQYPGHGAKLELIKAIQQEPPGLKPGENPTPVTPQKAGVVKRSGAPKMPATIKKEQDAVYDDVTENSPTEIEGATELEGKEVRTKEHTFKDTGVNFKVAKIMERVLGSRIEETGEKDSDGKKVYKVTTEALPKEFGKMPFDGDPLKVADTVAKIFITGRNSKVNRIDLGDRGGKLNAQEVIKLGGLIDEQTRDSKLPEADRILKQFFAGMSFLADNGFVPKRVVRKTAAGEMNLLGVSGKTTVFTNRAKQTFTLAELKAEAKETNSLTERYDDVKAELEEGNGNKRGWSRPVEEIKSELSELRAKLKERGVSLIEHEQAIELSEMDREEPNSTDRDDVALDDIHAAQVNKLANEIASAQAELPASAADTVFQSSQVAAPASPTIKKNEVSFVEKMLEHLGIMTKVIMLDERGVLAELSRIKGDLKLIEELLRRKGMTKKSKQAFSLLKSEYQERVASLESVLADAPDGRIIYNDRYSQASNRKPYIFISENVKRKRYQVISHEMGHLVQRAVLDHVSAIAAGKEGIHNFTGQSARDIEHGAKEIIKQLNDAHEASGSTAAFEEWFANELYQWSTAREVPKAILSKFFKYLGQLIKKMVSKQGKGEPTQAYADFMDSLVNATRGEPSTRFGKAMWQEVIATAPKSIHLMKNAKARQSADMSWEGIKRDSKEKISKARATRFGKNTESVARHVKDYSNLVWTISLKTNDSFLRAIGLDEFADHWHLRPDARKEQHDKRAAERNTEYDGLTIPQETNLLGGKLHATLQAALNSLPKLPNRWYDKLIGFEPDSRVDPKSRVYRAVEDALIQQVPTDSIQDAEVKKAVKAIRAHFTKVRDELTKMGIPIEERKNYFPVVFDVSKVLDNEAAFKKTMVDKLLPELKKLTPANIIDRGKAINEKLSDAEHAEGKTFTDNSPEGYANYIANQTFESLKASEHGVIDDFSNNPDAYNTKFGPSFGHMRQRMMDKDVLVALKEFMVTDIHSIMAYYTHAAARRGVIQRRFGKPTGKTYSKTVKGETTEHKIIDPMGKVNDLLDTISDSDQRLRVGKVVDAYLGRLGADSMPKLGRSLSGVTILYQNMRLLSMAVLTSLVDPGLVVSRGGLKDSFKGLADMVKTGDREDLNKLALDLGIIRDDMTDHVLNDQMSQQLLNEQFTKANEVFFKAIRMHQWTNLTRVFAMSAGRQFIHGHAKDALAGNKDSIAYMKELGLEKSDWKDAAKAANGRPDVQTWSPKLKAAMHQFVDESIMRPDASKRPLWGSDIRFAIFFHLKAFMFDFQETILRRIWSQVADKDASMASRAIAPAALAAAVLPLAALGYELRREIGHLGNAPDFPGTEGEYLWEVIQRSGMPGLAQMYIDADESEEYGRMSVLSVGGPTVSQFEEFFTKDFQYFALRAVPGVAQMPAVRNWIRDSGS